MLLVSGVLPGWIPPQEQIHSDDSASSENKSFPPSALDRASVSGSSKVAGTGAVKENISEQNRPLLQLGCDPSVASHRLLRSSASLAGLRYSEVLEWLAARRLSTPRQSMASSLTNMLGLGEGEKKGGAVRGISEKFSAATATTDASAAQKNEERLRRARVALCPLKLRLALLLCDHGFVRPAEEYVKEIKSALNGTNTSKESCKCYVDNILVSCLIFVKAAKKGTSASTKAHRGVSKGFERALEELAERLAESQSKLPVAFILLS